MIIMMWLSAEERRKISLRTRAGIARKKELGEWKGGRSPKKCSIKLKRKREEL